MVDKCHSQSFILVVTPKDTDLQSHICILLDHVHIWLFLSIIELKPAFVDNMGNFVHEPVQ